MGHPEGVGMAEVCLLLSGVKGQGLKPLSFSSGFVARLGWTSKGTAKTNADSLRDDNKEGQGLVGWVVGEQL